MTLETSILTYAPPAILLLPLLAGVVILAGGRRLEKAADKIAIGFLGFSLILSVALFVANVTGGGAERTGWTAAQAKPFVTAFSWLKVGPISLPLGFLVDNLSSFMSIIVTGLGTLVLVYSIFYMHGDRYYHRYFMYMGFFCFAMLGIVFSSNLLMTYIFWELVGLGSFFLIGFWFYKPAVADDADYQKLKAKDATGIDERYLSPAFAQKKAFVMNRIGDFGFLCGILIFTAVMVQTGRQGGVLDFANLYEARGADAFDGVTILGLSGKALLTLAGILTFMGAIGKSAQFPLHTWLPDAMQGPTTGSSIIHAATMVAAGVYMTARLHPLLTPNALLFVAFIGGITAFLGATMAMVQWDIKAVLAYSTISQLGYMMLGLGSNAYTAGIAHLFTHAIFKCMLFLCAGSVIHACHHLQDMNRMGGLKDKMPKTYLATLAGVLAITGVPGFSGFYSKDAILGGAAAAALEHGGVHWLPFLLGVVTAVLTAFYMFRLLFMTFHGHPRDHHVYDHAHESPALATVPLLILAVGCLGFWWGGHLIGGDIIGLPGVTVHAEAHGTEGSVGWIKGLITSPAMEEVESRLSHEEAAAVEHHHHVGHWLATGLSILALLVGWLVAKGLYLGKADAVVPAEASPLGRLRELFRQLWYFDRLYQGVIVPCAKCVCGWLFFFDFRFLDQVAVDGWAWVTRGVSRVGRGIDDWFVDWCVDAIGHLTWFLGGLARLLQAGWFQYYACVTFGVVVLVLLILLF